MNDSVDGVIAPPIPLFASSWVALFVVIRHSFSARDESKQPSEKPVAR